MADYLFRGGDGSELNPFLVGTPLDLHYVRFRQNPLDHYKQISNIDLITYEHWTPIQGNVGSYDGNGFKISNMSCIKPEYSWVGLFGEVVTKELKNIRLENVKVFGQLHVAGLVGSTNGDISNCSVTGDISASWTEVGGIVGTAKGKRIENCFFRGNLKASHVVGGIAGVSTGLIKNCYAEGSIDSTTGVGGIVGSTGSTVEGCFTLMKTMNTETYYFTEGNITKFGDIVGAPWGDFKIINSYTLDELRLIVTGHWEPIPTLAINSTGRITDIQAKRRQTYESIGWDFNTVWGIDENTSYPYHINMDFSSTLCNRMKIGLMGRLN